MMAIVYAVITSLATLLGGWLPQSKSVRRIPFRYLVAFAAGAMVSIAFFDILPELPIEGMTWVGIGFFAIYIIEKFILLHQCGDHNGECEVHGFSGWPAMVGVAGESLIDGIAIGVGYTLTPALGAAIAIAVIAHELPRGFTTAIMMRQAGKGTRSVIGALAIDAGFTPIGAALALAVPLSWFTPVLGFVAGTFLYVGAADLLPESHKKFNWKSIACVLLGALIIWGVTQFVHQGLGVELGIE